MEGENPTRRYKWFRPRQAYRGAVIQPQGTNYSTVYLFNDSTAAQYMVVRDVVYLSGFSPAGFVAHVQGHNGTEVTTKGPIVAGAALGPGKLFYDDTTTQLTTYDYTPQGLSPTWNPNIPIFSVLPPGWSLVVQSPGTSVLPYINFIWEAVFADELDFLW